MVVCSYLIAHAFFSVYSMCVDTLFLCFCKWHILSQLWHLYVIQIIHANVQTGSYVKGEKKKTVEEGRNVRNERNENFSHFWCWAVTNFKLHEIRCATFQNNSLLLLAWKMLLLGDEVILWVLLLACHLTFFLFLCLLSYFSLPNSPPLISLPTCPLTPWCMHTFFSHSPINTK